MSERQEFQKFGAMASGMIARLDAARQGEDGFVRRTITYRGGTVELIFATKAVADAMEEGAAMRFNVQNSEGR